MSRPKPVTVFAKELRDLLIKHNASLTYTIHDNGVHISVGGIDYIVPIGWPDAGRDRMMEELNEVAGT